MTSKHIFFQRFFLLLGLSFFFSSCFLKKERKITARNPSFVLSTRQNTDTENENVLSYTRVVLNNIFTNDTEIKPLNEVKRVVFFVPPDNYLVKLTKFIYSSNQGGFIRLDASLQPKEKFVYVLSNKTTYVDLRYTKFSRKYEFRVSQEACTNN